MYLTKSDGIGDPIHDLSQDPMWINQSVQGVALRTQWGRLEPHEHANTEDFYWGFLDQGVELGRTHNKKVSILVTAGVTTPDWVYAAGAYAFHLTQAIFTADTNGTNILTNVSSFNGIIAGEFLAGTDIPDGTTILSGDQIGKTLTLSAAATGSHSNVTMNAYMLMPLPWDPVFQPKWSPFVQILAARFGAKPHLVYVVMGGFGRRAESFFVTFQQDQDALDAKAVFDGFSSSVINGVVIPPGMTGWKVGAKWVTDRYGERFLKVPFICDLGAPAPTEAGTVTLQDLCDYSAATYPGRFGVKSDGLGVNGPPDGSIGETEVRALSPTTTVGYQFTLPQNDPNKLDLSLKRGIGFGAHFIETYSKDCDDVRNTAILLDAANQMLAV